MHAREPGNAGLLQRNEEVPGQKLPTVRVPRELEVEACGNGSDS